MPVVDRIRPIVSIEARAPRNFFRVRIIEDNPSDRPEDQLEIDEFGLFVRGETLAAFYLDHDNNDQTPKVLRNDGGIKLFHSSDEQGDFVDISWHCRDTATNPVYDCDASPLTGGDGMTVRAGAVRDAAGNPNWATGCRTPGPEPRGRPDPSSALDVNPLLSGVNFSRGNDYRAVLYVDAQGLDLMSDDGQGGRFAARLGERSTFVPRIRLVSREFLSGADSWQLEIARTDNLPDRPTDTHPNIRVITDDAAKRIFITHNTHASIFDIYEVLRDDPAVNSRFVVSRVGAYVGSRLIYDARDEDPIPATVTLVGRWAKMATDYAGVRLTLNFKQPVQAFDLDRFTDGQFSDDDSPLVPGIALSSHVEPGGGSWPTNSVDVNFIFRETSALVDTNIAWPAHSLGRRVLSNCHGGDCVGVNFNNHEFASVAAVAATAGMAPELFPTPSERCEADDQRCLKRIRVTNCAARTCSNLWERNGNNLARAFADVDHHVSSHWIRKAALPAGTATYVDGTSNGVAELDLNVEVDLMPPRSERVPADGFDLSSRWEQFLVPALWNVRAPFVVPVEVPVDVPVEVPDDVPVEAPAHEPEVGPLPAEPVPAEPEAPSPASTSTTTSTTTTTVPPAATGTTTTTVPPTTTSTTTTTVPPTTTSTTSTVPPTTAPSVPVTDDDTPPVVVIEAHPGRNFFRVRIEETNPSSADDDKLEIDEVTMWRNHRPHGYIEAHRGQLVDNPNRFALFEGTDATGDFVDFSWECPPGAASPADCDAPALVGGEAMVVARNAFRDLAGNGNRGKAARVPGPVVPTTVPDDSVLASVPTLSGVEYSYDSDFRATMWVDVAGLDGNDAFARGGVLSVPLGRRRIFVPRIRLMSHDYYTSDAAADWRLSLTRLSVDPGDASAPHPQTDTSPHVTVAMDEAAQRISVSYDDDASLVDIYQALRDDAAVGTAFEVVRIGHSKLISERYDTRDDDPIPADASLVGRWADMATNRYGVQVTLNFDEPVASFDLDAFMAAQAPHSDNPLYSGNPLAAQVEPVGGSRPSAGVVLTFIFREESALVDTNVPWAGNGSRVTSFCSQRCTSLEIVNLDFGTVERAAEHAVVNPLLVPAPAEACDADDCIKYVQLNRSTARVGGLPIPSTEIDTMARAFADVDHHRTDHWERMLNLPAGVVTFADGSANAAESGLGVAVDMTPVTGAELCPSDVAVEALGDGGGSDGARATTLPAHCAPPLSTVFEGFVVAQWFERVPSS